VVGVLVRACKGGADAQAESPWAQWAPVPAAAAAKTAACNPVVLGAPVDAIRSFLSKTPAAAIAPAPWLGIRGEAAEAGNSRGVRVLAVASQSPAEKAGLKANSDLIVAVDGQPVDSPEKLADAIGKHAPGDNVKLLVTDGASFRDANVVLRTAP
jgi:serine protease Do